MRMACSDLFKIQYKKMRKISFPCVKSHMTDIVSIYWVILNSSITCILSMKYITLYKTKKRSMSITIYSYN